jgi:hypothetical protein
MTVAGLLEHLRGLTTAFTDAARKAGEPTKPGADWRRDLPRQLEQLAEADHVALDFDLPHLSIVAGGCQARRPTQTRAPGAAGFPRA